MIATPALWVTFVAMVPLMVLASLSDLKSLKIPNWLVLAVAGVFVVTGLWGLPLDVFVMRVVTGLGVLCFGFALFSFGAIGGGDAKMAAALAPFVVPGDIARLLLLYAIITFVMLMVLRLVMQVYRHEETGWHSVDQLKKPPRERVFPMGLIFGLTITVYLGAHTLKSLGIGLGL